MSYLREFQQAAVERITQRLNAKGGSGRFLLADEVGLGKTHVARGVLDSLALAHHKKSRKGLVCVYLCSNLEILLQNQDKLSDEEDRQPPIRLTMLADRASAIRAKRNSPEGKRQLFLFTPGTSLTLGGSTGIRSERRLLLVYLSHWMEAEFGRRRNEWIEFFRCGAGQSSAEARERWVQDCSTRKLREQFKLLKKARLYQKTISRWKSSVVSIDRGSGQLESMRLSAALTVGINELSHAPKGAKGKRERRNRNLIIGELRKGLSEAALEFLAPDVILVDEFQRFRDVIRIAASGTDLAGQLFLGAGVAPRVLVLSATPYKAVTFEHDKEQHYQDFENTLTFLLGQHPDRLTWLEDVKRLLIAFKEGMTCEVLDFPKILHIKSQLEDRLKEVMCRTERSRYLLDLHKGVEERPDLSQGHPYPTPSEAALSEFVSLRRFLQKHEKEERPFPSITDFWKSCSSIITFMDSNYSLIQRLKKAQTPIEPELLQPEAALNGIPERNLKMGALVAGLREGTDTGVPQKRRWPFLWLKPTYLYYGDHFFQGADPTKFLVFSRWRFVPKAIAFVVSREFESTRSATNQALELNSEALKVCLPLKCLASAADPAAFAVEDTHTGGDSGGAVKRLRQLTRKRLLAMFASEGIVVSKQAGRKQFWPALLALEQSMLAADTQAGSTSKRQTLTAILSSAIRGNRNEVSQADELAETLRGWCEKRNAPVVFPEEMLGEAVTLALSSPAVCLLRAAQGLFRADRHEELLRHTARLCFQDLRTYFNKGYVQEVIGGHARAGRYADQIQRYCFDAHFQAMIDEYAYLVREVLGRNTLRAFFDHLGRVFAVGAATPNINVPTSRSGRIREQRAQRPVNYAMAFGEENQPDEGTEKRASRKTSVREAFNSPFWPFVLATTSVGQEGLDFHLYCRDVMHWNLPANPVDLEQREGRINRFDGLVVRRNVCSDYPLSKLNPHVDEQANLWSRVFDQVETHPTGNQQFKHGLFPHWVFEPANGNPLRIRRHLAFFDGSRDRKHYERLKKYLFYYRLAFGQARQQDLLDKIVGRPDEAHIRSQLQACMINLSPFSDGHAWERARREAKRIAAHPAQITALLANTRALYLERSDELSEIREDIEELWAAAERVRSTSDVSQPDDIRKTAALIYLLNPYDERFDGIKGTGLQDDVAVIKMANRPTVVSAQS